MLFLTFLRFCGEVNLNFIANDRIVVFCIMEISFPTLSGRFLSWRLILLRSLWRSFLFFSFHAFFCLFGTINRLWEMPRSQLMPIIHKIHCKSKLYEAQQESNDSDRPGRVIFSTSILNCNIIENDEIEANENRCAGSPPIRRSHVFFVYVVNLLQIVGIFDFLLYGRWKGKQGNYFISVAFALHLRHDFVSEIAG